MQLQEKLASSRTCWPHSCANLKLCQLLQQQLIESPKQWRYGFVMAMITRQGYALLMPRRCSPKPATTHEEGEVVKHTECNYMRKKHVPRMHCRMQGTGEGGNSDFVGVRTSEKWGA